MKYLQALKAAGLLNPVRNTWHGVASDGTPVFTIWSDDVRVVDGRFFAWWDFPGGLGSNPEPSLTWKTQARRFIELAALNIGKDCRAVIVYPRHPKPTRREAASAEYPHAQWGTATFRTADTEALHFIAELTS